jgi:hypothetical protein
MECATWSAKYTTIARLANSHSNAADTASRGYSSAELPTPTVNSPQLAYTKVATNTPSETWLGRSRRKLRNSLGENCVEDICSATTVNPSIRAITVTTVEAMVASSARASSALP